MLMAKPTEPGSLAHLLAAPPLWEVEGLQRDRTLQRPTFRYKRELRQECIPICHDDDVEYRLRLRMALPLMNVEYQNKWMWLRPMLWRSGACRRLCYARPPRPLSPARKEHRSRALGVHGPAGVFRPRRCVHPQCDEITTCLSEKSDEIQRCMHPGVRGGDEAKKPA